MFVGNAGNGHQQTNRPPPHRGPNAAAAGGTPATSRQALMVLQNAHGLEIAARAQQGLPIPVAKTMHPAPEPATAITVGRTPPPGFAGAPQPPPPPAEVPRVAAWRFPKGKLMALKTMRANYQLEIAARGDSCNPAQNSMPVSDRPVTPASQRAEGQPPPASGANAPTVSPTDEAVSSAAVLAAAAALPIAVGPTPPAGFDGPVMLAGAPTTAPQAAPAVRAAEVWRSLPRRERQKALRLMQKQYRDANKNL